MSEAINRLGDAKNFVSLGYTNSALMAIDDAIKILQAAQAQAQGVNQQLLEALRLLYEAAGSIKVDEHMLKNYPTLLGAVRVADIAIAAAQENNK